MVKIPIVSKSKPKRAVLFNPLLDMPILASSNLAANKEKYDVKNMDKYGTII